jgi:2-phospho-L-lactate transferase/gluconeogenesis factor (CofD/UPF0052 family)
MLTLRRGDLVRAGAILPASLDQALHRCIALASRFGAIRLKSPDNGNVREFILELEGSVGPRLRWTLRRVASGTQLTIDPPHGIARLTSLGRRGSAVDRQLGRGLHLLPQIASLKIAVIGGGTGLYTTLLGLRDRSWSLTAVISGLPRNPVALAPKDQLGALPSDDAGLCLVGLTPTIEENVVLRSLLGHRMESTGWRHAHFGTALLTALEEISGSRQAALDTAAELLGIRGRIVVALSGASVEAAGRSQGGAVAALADADMIVIAPGHLELDLIPVLCCPGVIGAVRDSRALKVVVTKIMTAEAAGEVPRTSHYLRPLSELIGTRFDVALANSRPFSPGQLRAYIAAGADPIRADIEATAPYAVRVLTEPLAAAGDLARHDPDELGQCLVEIGAEHLLSAGEAEARGA